MTRLFLFKPVITTGAAIGALMRGRARSRKPATYLQTDLVSDIPGLAAITDSNLTNPWGVSFLPGSPDLDFEPGLKYGHALSGDG